MKFNFSKTHGIEYTPSAMFKFDLNVTSFKLSSASWWPKGHHSASAGNISMPRDLGNKALPQLDTTDQCLCVFAMMSS